MSSPSTSPSRDETTADVRRPSSCPSSFKDQGFLTDEPGIDKDTSWKADSGFWDLIKESRHGEVKINGRVCKYVFMTDTGAKSQTEIEKILKIWNLKRPNLVMQLNKHNTALNNFVSKEMCDEQESFATLKGQLTDKSQVNVHVHNCLVDLFSNMATSCETSNCWFFSEGLTKTNWMMLTEALRKTRAKPTILAAHDVVEFTDGGHPATDQLCKDMFFDLLNWSLPLSEEKASTHTRPVTFDRECMTEVDRNDLPEWYPDAKDKMEDSLRRYDAAKQPNWVLASMKGDYTVPDEGLKFEFRCPNLAATHFIFTQHKKAFDAHLLGNAGWLMVGGGWHCSEFALPNAMTQADPVILVDNTGGETQQYARLIKQVLALQRRGHDEKGAGAKVQALLDYAILGTKAVPEVKGMNLGMRHLDRVEVLKIIGQIYDRPRYFKETLVIVDVLKDKANVVLRKTGRSFASRAMQGYDSNAGEQDAQAVQKAWVKHHSLSTSSVRLVRKDTRCVYVIALCTFFGTACSVSKLSNSQQAIDLCALTLGHDKYDDCCKFIKTVVMCGTVLFPACAAVFTAILSHFKYHDNATALSVAAAKIVREIYLFRMRVGDYELMPVVKVGQDTSRENDGPLSLPVRQDKARKRFTSNIQTITEEVPSGTDFVSNSKNSMTPHQLDEHINRALYFSTRWDLWKRAFAQQRKACRCPPWRGVRCCPPWRGASCPPGRNARRPPADGGCIDVLAFDSPQSSQLAPFLDEDEQAVEHAGTLSCAQYFQTRFKSLLDLYQWKSRRVSSIESWCQVLLILLSCLASFFAPVQVLNAWVPLLFAATSLVKTLSSHGNVSPHRQAVAQAVGQLDKIERWWTALSAWDTESSATRNQLVSITESTVLDVVSAHMGVAVPRATVSTSDDNTATVAGAKDSDVRKSEN